MLRGYAHASPQNCLFLTLFWNLIPAQSCGRFLPLYSLLGWRTSLQRLKVAAHVLVMVVSVASDWWVGDGIFAAPLRFRNSSLALPEFLSGPAVPVPFGTQCRSALLQTISLTYIGLTTELRLVFGFLWTSADRFIDSCTCLPSLQHGPLTYEISSVYCLWQWRQLCALLGAFLYRPLKVATALSSASCVGNSLDQIALKYHWLCHCYSRPPSI